jgi:chromosomal replication initiator protein
VLIILEQELTNVVFNTIIKPLVPLSLNNDIFIIKASSEFFKKTITTRYIDVITMTLREVTNINLDVRIVTDKELSNTKELQKNNNFFPNSNINSKYLFENFIRGKSNELAYAAATAIAEAPGKTSYNPLFIYGGVGLGKTHLMYAIGNKVLEKAPTTKILYCSTETFTNELITSIKEKKNQLFRNKYREIDVLLIDDIQFLSEKEGTQEEFFHTFNTLYSANKQIVISSDQPPKEIKTLADRLRSRFASGLIADITLPDFETRCAILQKKAELDRLNLSNDIISFIASNIISNIRDLEGALNKVAVWSRINSNTLTLSSAQDALKDLLTEDKKTEITAKYIQNIVCDHFNILTDEMLGKKRNQSIVHPRQIAMYLTRKLTELSLPQIGQAFDRDHSTVIHSSEKIQNDIKSNTKLQAIISELENKIKPY